MEGEDKLEKCVRVFRARLGMLILTVRSRFAVNIIAPWTVLTLKSNYHAKVN